MNTRTVRQKNKISNFTGGQQDFTSILGVHEQESPLVLNCDIRRPGVLAKSQGYSLVGSEGSSGAIKGLGVFSQEDGTHTLLKAHGTALYKYTSGSWSSIKTGLNDNTDRVEMITTYTDSDERVYFAQGHSNVLGYWDGTTYATVANTYAKHIEYFENQIYLGNCKFTSTVYPHRVQFSAVGADTFNTTDDYFEDMGAPITALKTYAGKLYCFTENRVGAWDGYSLREIPGNYGTTSARTVQTVESRLVWFNRAGVYMYAGSGLPELISRPVQTWIDAITDSSAVAGGIDPQGRYLLYLGDITYKGTEYLNVVLRYDVLVDGWDVLYARPFSVMTVVPTSGLLTSYAGDLSDDRVYLLGGTSLEGSAIDSTWESSLIDGDDIENTKNFYKVAVVHRGEGVSENCTVKYSLDGQAFAAIEGTANNIPLSSTSELVITTMHLPANTQGNSLRLRVTHSSDTGDFEVYEIITTFDEIMER